MKSLDCYIKVPCDNYRHDFKVEIEEDYSEQQVIDTIIYYAIKNVFKIGADNYNFTHKHNGFLENGKNIKSKFKEKEV